MDQKNNFNKKYNKLIRRLLYTILVFIALSVSIILGTSIYWEGWGFEAGYRKLAEGYSHKCPQYITDDTYGNTALYKEEYEYGRNSIVLKCFYER